MELLANSWKTGSLPFSGRTQVAIRSTPPRALQVCNYVRPVNRKAERRKRHARVRRKLSGTPERPRLAVFTSAHHIYCQVIDDEKHITLASMSTLQEPIKSEEKIGDRPNKAVAERIGKEIAKVCLEKGITKVVYDRGGFSYIGRVQALAEGARAGGLEF